MKKLFPILFLMAGIFSFSAVAQQAEEEVQKKVKIKIVTSEDGETKETTKEIILDDESNLEDILKDVDISGLSEGDEDIKIVIRKGKEGHDMSSYEHFFDFDFEMPMEHMKWVESAVADVHPKALLGVHSEGLEEGKGAKIIKVIEGSAAEKAGLQEGDIIYEVNDEAVTSHADLAKKIGAMNPGDEVKVEFERAGKKEKVTTELGERTYNAEEIEHRIEKLMECHKNMAECQKKCEKKMYKFHDASSNKAFLGITNKMVKTVEDGKEIATEENGVLINSVVEKSTAEEMGLQEGDIIKAVDGKGVKNMEDLIAVLKEKEVGDQVKITYERSGMQSTASGALKAREELDFFFKEAHPHHEVEHIMIKINIEDITAEEAKKVNDQGGEKISPDNDLEVSTVEFMPNPGNGNFQLKFELPEVGDTQVKVIDMNGRVVYNQDLGAETTFTQEIDISDEPNGIYFLSITQNGKQFNKKIVKQ